LFFELKKGAILREAFEVVNAYRMRLRGCEESAVALVYSIRGVRLS
jgi:hypothetical protein